MITVPDGAHFKPQTGKLKGLADLDGGILAGANTGGYALELDSPTAVRTANRLILTGSRPTARSRRRAA